MNKKLSTGRIIFHVISVIIIIILMVFAFLSRDIAIIATGNYATGSEEETEYVKKVFGEDGEENFNLYFKWFNVLHESGHLIRFSSGEKLGTAAEEEILVTRYAAAYWREFGEKDKYEKLREVVSTAQSKLTNPAPKGVTIEEWVIDNYNELLSSDTMFNDYGYFQFGIGDTALNSDESLEDVLYEMTGKKVKIDKKELKYKVIDNKTCDKILEDEQEILKDLGIKFPKYLVHKYVDGSANHYSTSGNPIIPIMFIGLVIIANIEVIFKKTKKEDDKKKSNIKKSAEKKSNKKK